MKMEFYYIGHDAYANRNIPAKPFETVEIKDKKTGEITLYPVVDKINNKLFISNKGWIKKCKTKKVPVFSLKEKDWEKYRKKYGDYCLFYSLTGNDLVAQDYCIRAQQDEYNSLCVKPDRLSDYKKFMMLYKKINSIQKKLFELEGLKYIERYKYLFVPLYSESLKFLSVPVTYDTDVYGDDKRLENVYEKLKGTRFSDTVLPEDMSSRIELIYGKECLDCYNELINMGIKQHDKKEKA